MSRIEVPTIPRKKGSYDLSGDLGGCGWWCRMDMERIPIRAEVAGTAAYTGTFVPNALPKYEEPTYRGKRIAVVVPAYNEELLIGETLGKIPDFVARVYAVNDCSTDQTQKILDSFALHDKSLIPLRHDVNKGVGAAIVTG